MSVVDAHECIIIPGDAPYDVSLTPYQVARLLELPVLSDTFDSLAKAMRGFTPRTLQSFHAVLQLRQDLYDRYCTLENDYAALSYEDGKWPEPAPSMITEEVFIEAEPVSHLVYVKDGRRFLRLYSGELRTFAEFEAAYSVSVANHLIHIADERINRMKRAAELLQVHDPYEAHVTLLDENGVRVDTIMVYDERQIEAYARRTRMHFAASSSDEPYDG
jgi:hypothetical protein